MCVCVWVYVLHLLTHSLIPQAEQSLLDLKYPLPPLGCSLQQLGLHCVQAVAQRHSQTDRQGNRERDGRTGYVEMDRV